MQELCHTLGNGLYPACADHLRYQPGICMVSFVLIEAWWLFAIASDNHTIEVSDHMAYEGSKSCDVRSQRFVAYM